MKVEGTPGSTFQKIETSFDHITSRRSSYVVWPSDEFANCPIEMA